VRVAQAATKAGSAGEQNPIYVLFYPCAFSGKGVETQDDLGNSFSGLTETRCFMNDKKRILVVDDQIAVAMMMVFLLTRAGCQAEAALTTEQALRRAQAEPFDLITIDIGMPGLDGFQLFGRLKEIAQLKEIPVIFVTGQAANEDRRRAVEMGAADFIEKPFDGNDFISRILSKVKPLPSYA
jgi:CheY-like chemotaxis protein